MDSQEPIGNEQPEHNAGEKSDKQPGHPEPEVSGAPNQSKATPPVHSHRRNHNKERDCIDWATLGLEGFGLFVLIVYTSATIWYAVITRGMWKEMQTQTKTARQQLELSERPWIYPEKLDMNAVYGPTLTLNNAGSSPAIVNQPRFAFFRLYKPQVRFWHNADPMPEDICETSKNDERVKFPVFPKVPYPKDIQIGDIPRRNETLTGSARSIPGCIVYYGMDGKGPYYTKVVYYVERNSDDTIKSATLMDIAVD